MSYENNTLRDIEDLAVAYNRAETNEERKEIITAAKALYGQQAGLELAQIRYKNSNKAVARTKGTQTEGEDYSQQEMNGSFIGINSGNHD